MKTPFEFCSLEYLKLWEEHDKNCHETLVKEDNKMEKLVMLKKAASFYRVARNLPTKHDEKDRRYGHLLYIMEDINDNDFKENPVDKIVEIEEKISKKYGNRRVL